MAQFMGKQSLLDVLDAVAWLQVELAGLYKAAERMPIFGK